jgi:hypothetical protein
VFSKPLRNVVAADVELVCSSRLPEGPEVEYKEALPTKSGTDPWVNGGDHIGERARKKVLEEIVAFANAFGGTLVIGIAETAEKPARANNIKPIPRCVELAERLSLQCRDCIDPKIPLIEIAGVPTQNDGAGIVIIRTPRSRMAPHRHAITRECYIRRADRSEKMTMREIQDLTLNVERGLAAIESRFDERKRYTRISSLLMATAQGHLVCALHSNRCLLYSFVMFIRISMFYQRYIRSRQP